MIKNNLVGKSIEDAKPQEKRVTKPSKTGTLTSLKTLVKNMKELEWLSDEEEKHLTELVDFVKNKIVEEL